MNGIITLGLPLSQLTQLLTSGLSLGDPLPPDEPDVSGGALQLDVPLEVVFEEAAPYTSLSFSVPPGMTRLTWQCLGTLSDVDLEGSLDNIHFSVIDNMDDALVQSLVTGVCFLRITINTGDPVTVIITAKREKF